ncbi:kelch-like protein 12 [Stylophora pistillata]|uniref:Kelch-like protein 12 n=1 Tax=Stylophora pistillata TaxID=50429 RepID=A0A2B4RGU1_STYPI|nr:kelch-like protein 12 [Stylophora pistillata]PFX15598.1 Kelch-like protein 12 [Stylophora pistillata]
MVAHADILLSKCAQFRNESQFIDVRLKVGEHIFPAHRIVLAANSGYFHAMFTDGMKEFNQEVIELKDESISPYVLNIILDSIYTGDLLVNEKNVSKVLAAADHLQVVSAVHQCCNFLLTEFMKLRFDFETYGRIWEIALSYKLKDLQDAAECIVAKMYTDVCESEEFLTHIGGNQLASLLSRDDLIAPSETFVLKSVMQWIDYKKEERMPVVAKVIGAVRLGLVDIGVVFDDLNTEEMRQIPEIFEQVHEASIYKHRLTYKPKSSVEQTKPRSKNPVLVAVLPGEMMQYFDVEAKTWKTLPVVSAQNAATHCFCAVSVGDKLMVAACDSSGNCIYCYDTDESMYAVRANGFQCFQRYNFARGSWQPLATLKTGNNLNLSLGGAVVLGSKVYVLERMETPTAFHIFNRGQSIKPAVLHCFDPQKDEWEVKATTSSPHLGSILIVVKSKLYVAGGKGIWNISIDMPSPVEMYDEETNTWSVVEQKYIPANKLGAVTVEGRVYFIINKFPIDSGIRIAHGSLNYTVLNEWENLGKIDQNAALGYTTIKR